MSYVHEKLDYLDSNIQYVIKKGRMEFTGPDMSGYITYDVTTDTFIINGNVRPGTTIEYWAANPIWRNYSYNGSGLPYPNPDVAYENTPNQGTIRSVDGRFTITVVHPSEYYVMLGKKLLKPHVHFKLLESDKNVTLIVADFVPHRSLTNLPNQPDRTIGR